MPLDAGKLQKRILWTSANGQFAVVAGPFPYGFVRTLTSQTVEHASKRQDLVSRKATERDDQYAKVRMRDLMPTSNALGDICP